MDCIDIKSKILVNIRPLSIVSYSILSIIISQLRPETCLCDGNPTWPLTASHRFDSSNSDFGWSILITTTHCNMKISSILNLTLRLHIAVGCWVFYWKTKRSHILPINSILTLKMMVAPGVRQCACDQTDTCSLWSSFTVFSQHQTAFLSVTIYSIRLQKT